MRDDDVEFIKDASCFLKTNYSRLFVADSKKKYIEHYKKKLMELDNISRNVETRHCLLWNH